MHWQRLSAVGRQRQYRQTLGCEYCRLVGMALQTLADISDLFQGQSEFWQLEHPDGPAAI